jgi:hypothetical protein
MPPNRAAITVVFFATECLLHATSLSADNLTRSPQTIVVDRFALQSAVTAQVSQNLDDMLARLKAEQARVQIFSQELGDLSSPRSDRDFPSLTPQSLSPVTGQLRESWGASDDAFLAATRLARKEAEEKNSKLKNYVAYLTGLKEKVKSESVDETLETLKSAYVPSDIVKLLSPPPNTITVLPEPDTPNATSGLLPFVSVLPGGSGQFSLDYPAVGPLVTVSSGSEQATGLCTATLVSSNQIITAAHCFCEPFRRGDACYAAKFNDPAAGRGYKDTGTYRFYLPGAGIFKITDVSLPRDYLWSIGNVRGDVALATLVGAVDGIEPLELADSALSIIPGTNGTIVGYGDHNVVDEAGKPISPELARLGGFLVRNGIKSVGRISTAQCSGAGLSDSETICWRFGIEPGDSSASTCPGDSGGPMMMSYAGAARLVAITSGGRADCQPGQTPFSGLIRSNAEWISTHFGTRPDGTNPQRHEVKDLLRVEYAKLSSSKATYVLPITSDFDEVRIGVNANIGTGVRLDATDTDSSGCASDGERTFQFCSLPRPPRGQLKIEVTGQSGTEYQLFVGGI